jgi:hypothetical protein
MGWYFGTDSSCNMGSGALGCTAAGRSYAMDKWCKHNCFPLRAGQPSFCPASHCDCPGSGYVPPAPTSAPINPLGGGGGKIGSGTMARK